MPPKKAVFLDRDGTLIKIIPRPDFEKKLTAPFKFEELEFMPYSHSLGIMEDLKVLGFLSIIVTNQPDVANGFMTEDEWEKIHNTVIERLRPDDFFMCRHRTMKECAFKKPSPLMLLAAADKWGIDLSASYMVGDTHKDMEAGKAAGCTTILLETSYNSGTEADYKTPHGLRGVSRIVNRLRFR